MILACFFVVGLLTSVARADDGDTEDEGGGKFAILVGVQNYRGIKGYAPLKKTQEDMKKLCEKLKDLGYKKENLYLLIDDLKPPPNLAETTGLPSQTKFWEFFDKVKKAFNDNDREDKTLIVAFSGHGFSVNAKEGQKENFFVPWMDVSNDVRATKDNCISINRVFKQLDELERGNKILLVDACRFDESKAGDDNALFFNEETRGDSAVALMSCGPGQKSYEADNNGYFTAYLLDAIDYLRAQGGGEDGEITAEKIYKYMNDPPDERKLPLSEAVEKQWGFQQKPNFYRSKAIASSGVIKRMKTSRDFLNAAKRSMEEWKKSITAQAKFDDVFEKKREVLRELRKIENQTDAKPAQKSDAFLTEALVLKFEYDHGGRLLHSPTPDRQDALNAMIVAADQAINVGSPADPGLIRGDAYFLKGLGYWRLAELMKQRDWKDDGETGESKLGIVEESLKKALETGCSWNVDARILLANALLKQRDFQNAAEQYHKLLNGLPKPDDEASIPIRMGLGAAYDGVSEKLRKSGDQEKRRESCERALKEFEMVRYHPKSPARIQALASYNVGVLCLRLGDLVEQENAQYFAKAIDALKYAIDAGLEDETASAWETLCMTQLRLVEFQFKKNGQAPKDEIQKGIELCKKAWAALQELPIQENTKGRFKLLAAEFFIKSGDSDDAREALKKARQSFSGQDILNVSRCEYGEARCDFHDENLPDAQGTVNKVINRLEEALKSKSDPELTDLLKNAKDFRDKIEKVAVKP